MRFLKKEEKKRNDVQSKRRKDVYEPKKGGGKQRTQEADKGVVDNQRIEVLEYLNYLWDNVHCTTYHRGLKIENGLRIGSRMSPVQAEIMMKRYEEEKLEDGGIIRKFKKYENTSLGIWKGKREDLEE